MPAASSTALYINTFSTLAVGKARYGLMLREDGFVMDDGTTARLAEDHFFMTTTTANAAKVMQHLEFCQPGAVAGARRADASRSPSNGRSSPSPARARARLLQKLVPMLDLSNERFPYMAASELRWQDVPARLFRISFSGELAYEIACRRATATRSSAPS